MIDRRRFLISSSVLIAGASLTAQRSWAEEATAGNRRILFGYPPGALGTDLGRAVTELLAASGGPSYRFENLEGRNTRLAGETVKVAPADGMTLLQAQSTSMCLLPNVYKTLSYDAAKDFAPLAILGDMTMSLTVGPVVPKNVTTVAHFLDWLADNPDYCNVGFSIYGSEGHLATLILARSKGVVIRPQPYKGSLMMLSDLQNQTLAAAITAAGNGGPEFWSKGTLRSIGVTTAERLKYWPTIPTLLEQGVQNMNLSPWYAWFAPAATPAAITVPLREKITAMQTTDAYAALLKSRLLTAANLSPDQVIERIRKDTARYAELVATYGPAKID